MRQVQGTTGAATGAAGSMQHRARARREGLHRGRACRRSRAGMHGRQQQQGADWQGGTGRDGQRRPGRTHMQEGKERGLGPAAACRCSAQGIREGSGVYIGVERGFLALRIKRRVRTGLLVWAENIFPIFLFAKRFQQI